ncbi:MAG: PhoH family protein, partial [Spirosomaceae bacterium]|nr:PhoH family protein [Spirosomataceae bacterium]
MIERKISLDGISLIDFLGIQNANIRVITKAFPKTKVISRGSDLILTGSSGEIDFVQSIIQNLLAHVEKYGKLSKKDVESYVVDDKQMALSKVDFPDDVIVHGANGKSIKAKTANQRKLVAAAQKNDIVFAVGPAGTGKTYTAVAIAVQALKERKIKKIIITRPAVEAGENLGFLPGDLKEK